jgi:MFS family permease
MRSPDESRGLELPPAASFWILAVLLAFFLFGASAPSPLYAVYAAMWHFSSTTLTAIYAAYALGALTALLTTGRLSDHVGRRRILMLGLLVQIAGMITFLAAEGVGWLYAARILQGVGTGIATGAISAWLLDLQPADAPRLGSVVGGIALVAGLGAGALGSGLLVQYAPDPLHLVFWLLSAVYAVALVAMVVLPDPVARTPGWLGSMRPRIGVPAPVRSLFAASAPSLIATWAVGGLYLSLGPSLAISLLRSDSRVAGGLVIMALFGAGAVASALVRAADPRTILIRGSLVLIVGVGITLLAVAIGSTVGLYAGSIIAGLGFGPAFSGAFRSLAALAPSDKRGELLATVYIVVYVSFSVPTIIAGVAVTHFGLRGTTYAYGLAVMALAAVTTVAVSRRRAGPETPA